MNKLQNLNIQIENIFNKSRQLNDEDFDKFLFNIELIKKNIIQLRRKQKTAKLFEKESFFINFFK